MIGGCKVPSPPLSDNLYIDIIYYYIQGKGYQQRIVTRLSHKLHD